MLKLNDTEWRYLYLEQSEENSQNWLARNNVIKVWTNQKTAYKIDPRRMKLSNLDQS